MKEDYLWNKTGAIDPEIERLENALAVFRYQATDAPALPAKIIPFERKTPRSFFRLTLAFGAFAALTIACLGVWLQFPNGKIETAKDSPEIIAPQIVDNVAADAVPITKPGNFVVKKIETPIQSVERDLVKIKKSVPAVVRQNKPIARNVEVKKTTVKLTKEEKYAYDQLMLALSVTSSTLKKVKDKVEGVEEKTVLYKDGR